MNFHGFLFKWTIHLPIIIFTVHSHFLKTYFHNGTLLCWLLSIYVFELLHRHTVPNRNIEEKIHSHGQQIKTYSSGNQNNHFSVDICRDPRSTQKGPNRMLLPGAGMVPSPLLQATSNITLDTYNMTLYELIFIRSFDFMGTFGLS